MMNRIFIDTDEALVNLTGLDIPQWFKTRGENDFRRAEKTVLYHVCGLRGVVAALGGGAVLDEENRKMLAQSGVRVSLFFPAPVLARRLEHAECRPLLADGNNEAERIRLLDELISRRRPFYEEADLTLRFGYDVDPDCVSEMIVSYLSGRS